MGELVLRLLPYNHEPQEFVLQHHCLPASILDVASATSAYVFNDYEYQAQIIADSYNEINNLTFLLNGKIVDINYSSESGKILFCDNSLHQRIFRECYGFVQITILYDDALGKKHVRDTEYIQVLVRKGLPNDSVQRMAEYVYAQNTDLLYTRQMIPKDISGLNDISQKTIESHILLLKQISVTYEENFRYFKMNSRFVTTPQEHIERFEKLQYVSGNTLQYITQHPEQLQRVPYSSGIKIKHSRYQPIKTLVTSNKKTYDIYENRVVLGFLSYLVNEIERIEKDLSRIISSVPIKTTETDGYVSSSYFIYEKTVESIKILLRDIRELHQRFTFLYYMYTEILPIKPEIIVSVPRFTPLFKAIPQYHQIFDCTVAWFSKGIFSIREEQFMFSFIQISRLYEVYVLAKLINYFKDNSFTLECADKIQYPSPGKYYENTICNNRFLFKNDSAKITLYYQPVIYNTNRIDISGIGLYRNTSISFPSGYDGTSYRGKYYTPDFLIKYEYNGQFTENYLIADAKFSRLETVKKRELAELAYKYLFSISPISDDGHIVGMTIFNGISDTYNQIDTLTNVYDFEFGRPIIPRADIVTLTESVEGNNILHHTLLRNTVGLYATVKYLKPLPLPTLRSPSRHDSFPDGSHVTARTQISVDNEANQPTQTSISENKMVHSIGTIGHTIDISSKVADSVSTNKNKRKATIDLAEIPLSELLLDKDVEKRLIAAGYITLYDLVPNKSKKDLTSNSILNRKNRREIEARLKERRVYLN